MTMPMTAPPEFELSTETLRSNGAGVVMVRVVGDLDIASAGQLEAALGSDDPASSEAIVLDLTEVPFMDSSGLRAVLGCVTDPRCKLAAVVTPDSAVARLIELTEVGDRVPNFSSEEEAIAAVTKDGK